jgi:hypothetical protein
VVGEGTAAADAALLRPVVLDDVLPLTVSVTTGAAAAPWRAGGAVVRTGTADADAALLRPVVLDDVLPLALSVPA